MLLFTYSSVIFLKLSYCLSSEEKEQIKIELIVSIRSLLITVQLGDVSTTASPKDAKEEDCTGHCAANEFTKAHLCLQLRYINRSPEYFLYPSMQAKLFQPSTLMSQTTSTHFPQTSKNNAHPKSGRQLSRTSTEDFRLLKYLCMNPPFCTLKHAGHRKHPQRGKRIRPTGFNGKDWHHMHRWSMPDSLSKRYHLVSCLNIGFCEQVESFSCGVKYSVSIIY